MDNEEKRLLDEESFLEDGSDLLESEEFKRNKAALVELANAAKSVGTSPSFRRPQREAPNSFSSYSSLRFLNESNDDYDDDETPLQKLEDVVADVEYNDVDNTPLPELRGSGNSLDGFKKVPLLSYVRIKNKKKLIEQELREAALPRVIPYFTIFISLVDVIVLTVEILYNRGFEKLSDNIWLGPSADTLIALGAKDSSLMSTDGGFEMWRFITPMFLHVGVFHLALNLLAQIPFGLELERALGPWIVALIYFVSGITGNMLSAIFLTRSIEAGASSCIFGWLNYVVNWKYYRRAWLKVTVWSVGTLLSLALGLLPGVDNFARGSVGGAFCCMIVVPKIFTSQIKNTYWLCLRWTGVVLILGYLIIGLSIFYFNVDLEDNCMWCEYISCLPYWQQWCAR